MPSSPRFISTAVSMLCAVCVTNAAAVAVFAQQVDARQQPTPSHTAAVETNVSAEIVQSRLKPIEENKDLEETLKSKILDTYKQALELLRTAEEHAAKAAQWDKLVQEAPERVARLREELSAPMSDPEPEVPSDATLVQMEQLAARTAEQLTAAQKDLAAAESEPTRRARRRAEVPKRIRDVRAQLAEITAGLSAIPPAGEAPELSLANQTLLLARKRALEEELSALEKEIPAYDATVELMTLELRVAGVRLAMAERLLKAWKKLVEERRGSEVEGLVEDAQTMVDQLSLNGAPVELQELAAESLAWANRRYGPDGLAARIRRTAKDVETAEQQLRKLDEERTSIEEKLKIPGIEDVIGPLLLSQQRELPNTRRLGRNIRLRQTETSRIRLDMITVKEELANLTDLRSLAREIAEEVVPTGQDEQRAQLEQEALKILEFRRRTLEALNADYVSYFNRLLDLSTKEQLLISNADEFAQLINKHILWVRSTRWFDASQLTNTWRAVLWLIDPKEWTAVGKTAISSIGEQPVFIGASVLLLLLLVWKRFGFRKQLRQLGGSTGRCYTEPFSNTLNALLLTILIAAPFPAALWVVGTALSASLGASEFARIVGNGLVATSYASITVEIVRQLGRTRGLAESHFRWDRTRLTLLRRHLRWFVVLGLPCVFIVTVLERQEHTEFPASLGRLALMVGQVSLALFIARTCRPIRPKGPSVPGGSHASAIVTLPRWFSIGFLIAVFTPLVLAVLAGLGFQYTSLQLTWRTVQTAWLVLALIIAYGLFVRWLYLARGRLALEQLKRQRAAEEQAAAEKAQLAQTAADGTAASSPSQPAAKSQSQKAPSDGAPAQPAAPPAAESPVLKPAEAIGPAADLAVINEQTRRLTKIAAGFLFLLGAWLIWKDVLPALALLDQRVWTTTVEVTKTVTGPDNRPRPERFPEIRDITIGMLGLAVAVIVIAVVAARNIPGLLEVTVLQYLPFDSGGRYAISTLARYGITIVGIVVACNMIGLSWSKVQWLVAAMTFGLAFGMQEVFANFVSGVILLAERPLRVGDIATVGDVTGVVTKIRIRATTIRNWDRKEFIVPNKELITGRLLNWTLSDEVNRIVFNVGIAYGSDTNRARRVLQEIIANHPAILADPPPIVTFEAFGDSTLNFVVRAFLASMTARLPTINEVNDEIHRRFADEGIEIAFPQRDLHVRSFVAPGSMFEEADKSRSNGKEKAAAEPHQQSHGK